MASQARLESNALLRRWAASITGDVLSLGSGDDQDRQGHAYRQYFTSARSYTTSEFGADPGRCDLALDVRAMPQIADGRYDAIFCSGVLEHVDGLYAALEEIWRVLAPGGVLLLGVPFRQPMHRAPQDFWRFTEHGVRHLLSGYEAVEVVPIDRKAHPDFPSAYWVKALKPATKTVFIGESGQDATVSDVHGFSESKVMYDIRSQSPIESVVCWLWAPENSYKQIYRPKQVNVLQRMVARHYPHQHRFICVTDQREGLDPSVEVIPPWTDFAGIPSPHGARFPGCYRRLRAFARDIGETFGHRFVTLDLDCVITADLRPLWDRPEAFVAWKDTHHAATYNGSMILMTAGARSQVWETFDPLTSPAVTLADGHCNGSDQGWISYVLGPNEATWTEADGVYSFKNQMPVRSALPADARIVFMHGQKKPWTPSVQRLPWVKEHYHL